jgi:hypothetical protein
MNVLLLVIFAPSIAALLVIIGLFVRPLFTDKTNL